MSLRRSAGSRMRRGLIGTNEVTLSHAPMTSVIERPHAWPVVRLWKWKQRPPPALSWTNSVQPVRSIASVASSDHMSPVLYFLAGSVADVDWTHVVSTEKPSAEMRARIRAVHVSDDRVQSIARILDVMALASSSDIVHSRRGFVGSVSNRPRSSDARNPSTSTVVPCSTMHWRPVTNASVPAISGMTTVPSPTSRSNADSWTEVRPNWSPL
jgi:hypothetical protein